MKASGASETSSHTSTDHTDNTSASPSITHTHRCECSQLIKGSSQFQLFNSSFCLCVCSVCACASSLFPSSFPLPLFLCSFTSPQPPTDPHPSIASTSLSTVAEQKGETEHHDTPRPSLSVDASLHLQSHDSLMVREGQLRRRRWQHGGNS